MTERHKYFWPKLLAGFALALLVTDVLALSWLDTRLATSRQTDTSSLGRLARPTYTGIEQALILPTRDPNKQWPTRTPTPSPTPWLIPTAPVVPTTTDEPIPDRDAGLVSPEISIDDAESTPMLDPNPTASSLPEVTSDVVTPTRVIDTTSTVTPIGFTATPSPTPTSSPETTEGEIVPTDTPADVEPVATASTPEVVVPTATPPPFTAGDESQFLSYVESHYNSLAGQVLNLASVSIVQTPDGLPAAQIEISGEGENNVFAGQTTVAQQEFGGDCWMTRSTFLPIRHVLSRLSSTSIPSTWINAPAMPDRVTLMGSCLLTRGGLSRGHMSRGFSMGNRRPWKLGAQLSES